MVTRARPSLLKASASRADGDEAAPAGRVRSEGASTRDERDEPAQPGEQRRIHLSAGALSRESYRYLIYRRVSWVRAPFIQDHVPGSRFQVPGSSIV